ncbi:hypothetical protein [Arthrobacter sp. GMC3]|uniref:hypothetical protein n=1 Tax=Arthrobacter sp. GMC3 TaxID=2058894 RepID=UPI000CE5665A|nr:hypothetical protein [Arthrobacter sp. GMC3]
MTVLTPGMTCHRGKGKTLWEIIEVNDRTHMVSLSALGKGGYTNKHTTTDELTNILPQRLEVPLHLVLAKQTQAKQKASALEYQLRFCNHSDKIREAAEVAFLAADVFAAACAKHNAGLADLGIEAS